MSTRSYRELVGALEQLPLHARPDIAFATSSLARFGHNPGRVHWKAGNHVHRYFTETKRWWLKLGCIQLLIKSYADTDWGSDRDNQHSTRAYGIKGGCGAVNRKSKKKTCVVLSFTEAEHVALCQVVKESGWMAGFVEGLGVSIHDAMMVNVDDQGSITLAKNLVSHDRRSIPTFRTITLGAWSRQAGSI